MNIPALIKAGLAVARLRRDRKRLMRKAAAVGAAATVVMLCCAGAITAVIFDDLASRQSPLSNVMGCGRDEQIDLDAGFPRIGPYGENQIRNAATIINTGRELKISPRGWVIAIATAMQESSLTNHGYLGERNDHDSLGLFQQRPSQGWGTPEQIMDPVYSATKFYQKLLKIPGWEKMPLTVAAQRVQVSAYPDAYAKHEPLATKIVNELTDGAARSVLVNGALRCADAGEIAASGWTAPVGAYVVSGFRTAARPSHHGVDLGASRHTPIKAAASGVVIVSRCDVGTCAHDGSPTTPGCGWYVDITHAERVVTRYCHMQERPQVRVGDRVSAGQIIGYVGSTGNSSGPHLHFEVHVNGDRSSRGAVDPVPYMAARGAALGAAP